MLFPKHENVSTACRFTSLRPYVLAPLCPCALMSGFANYHPLLFAILKAECFNVMRRACSKVLLFILITGRG